MSKLLVILLIQSLFVPSMLISHVGSDSRNISQYHVSYEMKTKYELENFDPAKPDSISGLLKRIYLEANRSYAANNLPVAFELYNKFLTLTLDTDYEVKLWKEIGISLSYMSSISQINENIESSLQYLMEGLEITLKYDLSDYQTVFYLIFNIARNYYAQGDYYNALDYYRQAEALTTTSKIIADANKGLLFNNIALCLYKTGMLVESQDYLDNAIIIQTQLGEFEDLASLYNNLGLVFQSMKQYEKALFFLLNSAAIYDSISNDTKSAFEINNIGNLYLEQESYDTCQYYYKKALNIRKKSSQNNRIDLIQSLNNVAYSFVKKHLSDSAIRYNNLAIEKNKRPPNQEYINDFYSIPDYLITQADRIEINLLLYNQTRDKSVLLDSFNLFPYTISILISQLEKLNSKFSSNNLIKKNKRFFDLSMVSAHILDGIEGSKSLKTLIISETYKSLSLLDFPSEVLNLESDSIRENEARGNKIYYQLQQKLFMNSNISVSDRTLTIDSLINNTIRQASENRELSKLVYLNITNYYNDLSSSIFSKCQKLKDEDAFLDYYMTTDSIYIHVITQKQIIGYSLPFEFSLKDAIEQYPFSLKSIDSNLSESLSKTISKSLIEPISDLIKDLPSLIIIPSDIIMEIPFETLRCTGPQLKKGKYFIEGIDLCYKVSFLNRNYSNLNKLGDYKYDFIGIAPFEINDTIKNNLNGSINEIIEIQQLLANNKYKTNAYLGKEATSETFIKGCLNAKILHISTHSRINRKYSNFSKLELYPFENELSLSIPVISTLPFNNELIVLNSCESNKNLVNKTDGFVSFFHAILNPYVSNYICTVSKIYDEPSHIFILDFYNNLINGESYRQSLAHSKRNFINSELYHDPIFWSSFLLYENN